jgi:hypothetical protein
MQKAGQPLRRSEQGALLPKKKPPLFVPSGQVSLLDSGGNCDAFIIICIEKFFNCILQLWSI